MNEPNDLKTELNMNSMNVPVNVYKWWRIQEECVSNVPGGGAGGVLEEPVLCGVPPSCN